MTRDKDIEILERQLGRYPDGFQEVVRRTADGSPAVIRVCSIVKGVPFPTLYWLSAPQLAGLIYRYESDGETHLVQEWIEQDEDRQKRLADDNWKYIRRRESFYDDQVRVQLRQLGIEEAFAKKGIGGVANFRRVRCLHAYLAAHVVVPNLVGEWLASHYGPEDPLVIELSRLH